MSDIALTSAERSTLLLLQRTAQVRNEAAERLANGVRVNSTVDDPVAFNQASALTDRVGDLLAVKDDIGQGLSAVEASLDGLDTISTLTDQLEGIAQSALGGTAAERAAAAQQFDILRQQIDAVAQDSSFGGTNLLANQNLSISVNEQGGNITIDGTDASTSALGLGSAATDFNNFATDADIQAALSQLDTVQSSIRSSAATFGGDIASLSIREEFNTNLTNTLESGAQKLVETDLAEDAATLLAANVRDQLGLNGLQVLQQGTSLLGQLVGDA